MHLKQCLSYGCVGSIVALVILGWNWHCLGADDEGASGSGRTKPDILKVDPLLIEQAAQVWDIIGQRENPIWPGWDATETPMLFYLPGKQDLLVGHPNPPAGFRLYSGPIHFPNKTIHVRDELTQIEFDGQNTSTDVNGVQTLVVADTLSNLIPNLRAKASSPKGADSIQYDALRSMPLSMLEMIAHEAFHVYQHHRAPRKSGNELDLAYYPTLSIENNIGFELEGQALARAIDAQDRTSVRNAALEWIAIRKWRRKNLTEKCIQYEDGTEFNEGLAKYVEYRLTQVLEGKKPRAALWYIQSFPGFHDLQSERNRLRDAMLKNMSGEAIVNNDPYGAAPLRMRFYYSGMAIGVLLDKLNQDWKERILEPNTTLTEIAEQAIGATNQELEDVLARLLSGDRLKGARARKEQLASDGKEYVSKVLNEIHDSPETTVHIDYSKFDDDSVSFGFTPFGILAIDENRTVFRMVPIRAQIGKEIRFKQTVLSNMLQDRQNRRLSFKLAKSLKWDDIANAFNVDAVAPPSVGQPIHLNEIGHIELPGVELDLSSADIEFDSGHLIIHLARD